VEAVMGIDAIDKRGRGRPKGSYDEVMHPRPAGRLYSTSAGLDDKVREYFQSVDAKTEIHINDKTGIPTIIKTPPYYTRLLLFLGFNYTTVKPYEEGQYDDNINNYSDVLAYARMSCESDIAEGGMMGQYNDKMAVAVLKRHHGYSPKNEASAAPGGTLTADDALKLISGMVELLGKMQATKNVTPAQDVLPESTP